MATKNGKNVGRQTAPKRWKISEAALEFCIDDETLSKNLRAAGILKGDDGMFYTVQICAAIYGSIDGEKLRKARADADTSEIQRDKLLESILEADAAYLVWEKLSVSAKEKFRQIA